MKQNPILIPEIAHILCTLVEYKDLYNLALTCRVFYHASRSHLWKTLNPISYRILRKIKTTLDNTTIYNKFVCKFSYIAKEDIHHLERFFFNPFLFPNLRELQFSYAGAQDQIVSPMISAASRTLSSLNLSQCYCLSTNAIQPLFDILPHQLKSLVLYGCGKIDLEVIAEIIQRHSSSLIQIRLTGINDAILDVIQNCKKLKDLGLEHCNETNLSITTVNRFFEALLKNEIQLNYLRLRDIDSLTSNHLKIIAKSNCRKSLIYLDMSECNRINSIGVSWLARGCINLQTLSLAYQAGVTDQAIQLFINNCHQLKHMDISGCQLLTDHAFLPLLETKEKKSANIQLEKLNMSGLDLLSTSLIHHILNKLESLQELCLGVTYDLDQAYRILETINSCEPRFYLDTGKYYTICKIRAPLMLPYTCNRAPTNVNKATATNISRILTLPSSSTWNLPTSLFPL